MASTNSRKTGGSPGHPMLTGILIGLVAGVGMSAAVAVWVARMPSPFQNRALDNGGPAPAVGGLALPAATGSGSALAASGSLQGSGAAPSPGATAPGTAPGSPADAGAGAGARNAPANSQGSDAQPAPGPNGIAAGASPAAAAGDNSAGRVSTGNAAKPLESGTALVQVGAFANEDDALRQVETIAQVTGVHARILPPEHADHPLYRVRIGPVARGQELAELVDALKANGITSTVVRVPSGDTSR